MDANDVLARAWRGIEELEVPLRRLVGTGVDDEQGASWRHVKPGLPVLFSLARAAKRIASRGIRFDRPWWREESGPYCLFCDRCAEEAKGYKFEGHAPDCPAVEIDQALTDLAAFAP